MQYMFISDTELLNKNSLSLMFKSKVLRGGAFLLSKSIFPIIYEKIYMMILVMILK